MKNTLPSYTTNLYWNKILATFPLKLLWWVYHTQMSILPGRGLEVELSCLSHAESQGPAWKQLPPLPGMLQDSEQNVCGRVLPAGQTEGSGEPWSILAVEWHLILRGPGVLLGHVFQVCWNTWCSLWSILAYFNKSPQRVKAWLFQDMRI